MELTVGASFNFVTETMDADALGATLRIFQVAMLDSYAGVNTPQTNLSASIPWTRASVASVPAMSALCYYFGAELVKKHPDTPIGLLASSWGGTAIQPWMSPAALSRCKAAAPAPSLEEMAASADPALAVAGRMALLSRAGAGVARGRGRRLCGRARGAAVDARGRAGRRLRGPAPRRGRQAHRQGS